MNLSSLPVSGTNGSTLLWSRPVQPMWVWQLCHFKQNDDPTYLLLYVDDMLIAARNKAHIQKFKTQQKKKFNMKDLGEAKKILGMKITRDRGSNRLWLSQENYILKMLERFNMAKERPVTTPLAGYFKLSSKQCPQWPKEEEKEMSRVAVGSLIYVWSALGPT